MILFSFQVGNRETKMRLGSTFGLLDLLLLDGFCQGREAIREAT
jgi:hypothetical protein